MNLLGYHCHRHLYRVNGLLASPKRTISSDRVGSFLPPVAKTLGVRSVPFAAPYTSRFSVSEIADARIQLARGREVPTTDPRSMEERDDLRPTRDFQSTSEITWNSNRKTEA